MARITCVARPEGEIEIVGSGTLNAEEASLLITEIAKAAILAAKRDSKALPDRVLIEAATPYIQPTSIGLSEGPRQGFILLSLHFGTAEVGIPISTADGRQLARLCLRPTRRVRLRLRSPVHDELW